MTAREVFNKAMGLMDSKSDSTSYEENAIDIIDIGHTELASIEGLDTPTTITSLDHTLAISDKTARLVFPYFVASHLLLEENPNLAGFYNDKYEELKKRIPATPFIITDVYGGEDNG